MIFQVTATQADAVMVKLLVGLGRLGVAVGRRSLAECKAALSAKGAADRKTQEEEVHETADRDTWEESV